MVAVADGHIDATEVESIYSAGKQLGFRRAEIDAMFKSES
jgi:uncharacterized membrane protein YebE (DUF533 family)